MHPTKSLPALIAASLISLSAARADLTITYHVEQAKSQTPATLVVKIKDGKVRSDVSPEVSAIMDTASGDMVSLMHSQKMAMAVPGSALKQMAAAAGSEATDLKPPQPTGRKEKISGFECEEFLFEQGGQTLEVWITKEIPEGSDISAQLSKLGTSMSPAANATEGMKIDGFPVRTITSGPQGRVTITVAGLNRDELAASEFEIPSDYRKVEMPQLPVR